MDTNLKIYFYKGKPPFYSFPLVLLGFIAFSLLALVGLFIGVVIGAVAIGFLALRYFLSSKKTGTKRVEDNGRTIVLREDEYEVIEKRK